MLQTRRGETIVIDDLPNDVALLKRYIVEQQQAIERLHVEHQAAIENAVREAVTAILRRYYGPRSEKFDPKQLLLFGEQVDQQPLNVQSVEEEAAEKLVTRRIKHRDQHGRQQLPEHLELIEIEHDVENKTCPACGHERCRIGQEVSEQLEHFPASFKVLTCKRTPTAVTTASFIRSM